MPSHDQQASAQRVLQGDVVPHLYGTATCVDPDGEHFHRVLLLEHIEGHQLSTIPPGDKDLVLSMLNPTYEKLSRLDVIHGDPSLYNAIYVPAGWRATSGGGSWSSGFRRLLERLGLQAVTYSGGPEV